jgi:hypothetical protein
MSIVQSTPSRPYVPPTPTARSQDTSFLDELFTDKKKEKEQKEATLGELLLLLGAAVILALIVEQYKQKDKLDAVSGAAPYYRCPQPRNSGERQVL